VHGERRDEPPRLDYVPARIGKDSGLMLALFLFILTLLVWLLGAASAGAW